MLIIESKACDNHKAELNTACLVACSGDHAPLMYWPVDSNPYIVFVYLYTK